MHFASLHFCKELFNVCVAAMLKSGAFFVRGFGYALFYFGVEIMKIVKPVFFNIVGVVLGIASSIIVYNIAAWIFLSFLPKIPLIPNLLSWPVSYEWYALTGIITADIFAGVAACAFFCNLSTVKYNYGVIFVSLINLVRYVIDFINVINLNGFSFSMLLPYGVALISIFVAFSSGIENDGERANICD